MKYGLTQALNSLLSAGTQLEHTGCIVNRESGVQLRAPALFILSHECRWPQSTAPTDLMSGSKDQFHNCINFCNRVIRAAVISKQEY